MSCTAEVSIQFYLYIAKLHQQSPGSENVVHKKKAANNFPCKNKSNYSINIFGFTYYYTFFQSSYISDKVFIGICRNITSLLSSVFIERSL